MDPRQWELTLSDMLTLLLTFFVFIIAVSTFKTADYKKFWETRAEMMKNQTPTTSFAIPLIKGLKVPLLNPEAENLLNNLAETFSQSSFTGVDVNYNENKISLVVSEQLGFDGASADLKESAKPFLLKILPAMKASPFNVSVEGHTDTLTSEKVDNMKLSLNRALSVARFLIAQGLDKRKISVSGYGPYRAVGNNETLEGRQLNRRVEINIIINND